LIDGQGRVYPEWDSTNQRDLSIPRELKLVREDISFLVVPLVNRAFLSSRLARVFFKPEKGHSAILAFLNRKRESHLAHVHQMAKSGSNPNGNVDLK
jgi:hypothetical protein